MPKLATAGPVRIQLCEFFLQCVRPAAMRYDHPILGKVPCCDRCYTFASGIRQEPADFCVVPARSRTRTRVTR